MKKLLSIALVLSSLSLFAQEVPDYMKDGVITVKLKDGKSYTFSSNEYAVVKRHPQAKTIPVIGYQEVVESPSRAETTVVIIKEEKKKNIVSGELVRSQKGLDINTYSNQVDAENKYKLGVGLMYQRNIVDEIYLGGRIDSNGGTSLNLGLGF